MERLSSKPILLSAALAEASLAAFDTVELGLAMISQLPPDGNVVLSPLSLATVLALLYCGAQNATRDELSGVLRLSDAAVDRFAAGLQSVLTDGSTDSARLRSSTAVYTAIGYPVDPKYIKEVAVQRFSSDVVSMDFAKHPDEARQQINARMAKETAGLVKDLLPPGAVDNLTAAVVANAVHFKGQWLQRFEGKETRVADFHVNENRVVPVQMMRLSSKLQYGFSERHQLQLLMLPYSGAGSLSMLLMLPAEGVSLDSVFRRLSGDGGLAEAIASTWSTKVDVLLPRFSLESSLDVKQSLRAMGVRSLFARDADLTAMCPGGDVFVSSFLHKAVIDVNEEGTEAAAATAAVVMKRSIALTEHFHCNRPFAFAVWHHPTETAVFLGRVSEPISGGQGGHQRSSKEEL